MSNSVWPTISDINLEIEREQVYDTISQTESGGRDLGISSRTQARYIWRLSYGYLTEANAAALSAFQSTVKGRMDTFLFSDPLSPTATLWGFRDGIGTGTIRTTGNGTRDYFYLCDPNGDPVYASSMSGISVRVNGATLSSPSQYSLNVTYGAVMVIFASAPGNGVSMDWSGAYQRRVKFTEDGVRMRRVRGVPSSYSAEVELISQVLP